MKVAKNLLLLSATLFVMMMLLEFVVFRFVLPAADLPVLAANGSNVLRYRPDQYGIYRLQSEIAARFRINKQGWNSRHLEYEKEKTSEVRRICIVGDSYVEALQVDFEQSFAERLEDKMFSSGGRVEVFRFGISGAPLSQYIYWVRNEVLKYSPDLIILNLVHNDFGQSINPPRGTYSKSFSIVERDESGFFLTEPAPYQRDLSWFIKQSAIFRYLWVREQIRPDTLRDLLDSIVTLFQRGSSPRVRSSQDSALEVDSGKKVTMTENKLIEAATDFLFGEVAKITSSLEVPILLVMDGDRGRGFSDGGLNPLNKMVGELAKRHNLPLLDLSLVFQTDYEQYREDHQFETDGHWNLRSHALVASSLTEFLDQRPNLLKLQINQ